MTPEFVTRCQHATVVKETGYDRCLTCHRTWWPDRSTAVAVAAERQADANLDAAQSWRARAEAAEAIAEELRADVILAENLHGAVNAKLIEAEAALVSVRQERDAKDKALREIHKLADTASEWAAWAGTDNIRTRIRSAARSALASPSTPSPDERTTRGSVPDTEEGTLSPIREADAKAPHESSSGPSTPNPAPSAAEPKTCGQPWPNSGTEDSEDMKDCRCGLPAGHSGTHIAYRPEVWATWPQKLQRVTAKEPK